MLISYVTVYCFVLLNRYENTFFWEHTPEEHVSFPVIQQWSWGGLTPAIRAFYSCVLSHTVTKNVSRDGSIEWDNVGYLRAPGHRPDPYGRCVDLEKATHG